MKKATAIIAVWIILCFLSACSMETYDDGYEDGYSDGYSDAEDEEFFDGYDIGYDDGKRDGSWLEEDAIDYVREHSDWHPEEAVEVIEAYQNNEPFWRDGSPPSYEEYLDAIDSLIYFYDYFYSVRYK